MQILLFFAMATPFHKTLITFFCDIFWYIASFFRGAFAHYQATQSNIDKILVPGAVQKHQPLKKRTETERL